jgi:hypothetical protein
MRIDVKALRWMWKQTVWGTAGGMLMVVGLAIYFFRQSPPDYDAIRLLILLLLLMPVGLGLSYLVKRFIEGLGTR